MVKPGGSPSGYTTDPGGAPGAGAPALLAVVSRAPLAVELGSSGATGPLPSARCLWRGGCCVGGVAGTCGRLPRAVERGGEPGPLARPLLPTAPVLMLVRLTAHRPSTPSCETARTRKRYSVCGARSRTMTRCTCPDSGCRQIVLGSTRRQSGCAAAEVAASAGEVHVETWKSLTASTGGIQSSRGERLGGRGGTHAQATHAQARARATCARASCVSTHALAM